MMAGQKICTPVSQTGGKDHSARLHGGSAMGLFWDLIQQSQISQQRDKATSVEKRVERLEHDLDETRRLLQTLLQRLEHHLGEDIDQDGKVG
jgi:hypothetical protein